MRSIFLFMMTSLDGYMEGLGHDLSWHNVDAEFNEFAVKQLQEADTILFGRKTYQLMESFWPARLASESVAGRPEQDIDENDVIVAKLMNETPKVVISKSLENVIETDVWKNVKLIKDNIQEEVQSFKNQEGKSIVVLGSNNLCVTLLELGLLDEIRIMINPVVIGQGTPLFAGIKEKQKFTLTNTRNFKNGNVLLTYQI